MPAQVLRSVTVAVTRNRESSTRFSFGYQGTRRFPIFPLARIDLVSLSLLSLSQSSLSLPPAKYSSDIPRTLTEAALNTAALVIPIISIEKIYS